MKLLQALAFAGLVLLTAIAPSQAQHRIQDDPGGVIALYILKYDEITAKGETIVIDGECASACTLVLGLVPPEKVCRTPRASLGFHSAYYKFPSGKTKFSSAGTAMLWANYPERVRAKLRQRGWNGKTHHPNLIVLKGRDLHNIIKECP